MSYPQAHGVVHQRSIRTAIPVIVLWVITATPASLRASEIILPSPLTPLLDSAAFSRPFGTLKLSSFVFNLRPGSVFVDPNQIIVGVDPTVPPGLTFTFVPPVTVITDPMNPLNEAHFDIGFQVIEEGFTFFLETGLDLDASRTRLGGSVLVHGIVSDLLGDEVGSLDVFVNPGGSQLSDILFYDRLFFLDINLEFRVTSGAGLSDSATLRRVTVTFPEFATLIQVPEPSTFRLWCCMGALGLLLLGLRTRLFSQGSCRPSASAERHLV